MKNKLIVISADALVAEDMELFKTLPNFKKYLSLSDGHVSRSRDHRVRALSRQTRYHGKRYIFDRDT